MMEQMVLARALALELLLLPEFPLPLPLPLPLPGLSDIYKIIIYYFINDYIEWGSNPRLHSRLDLKSTSLDSRTSMPVNTPKILYGF